MNPVTSTTPSRRVCKYRIRALFRDIASHAVSTSLSMLDAEP